jgi:hypothetical protein
MAFTAKVLAQGQVPAVKTTIYTTPALTKTYIKYMSFFNVSAGVETVDIFINPSGTSRQIRKAILSAGEVLIIDESIILEAGDLIEADSTTATAIDYIITGGEET